MITSTTVHATEPDQTLDLIRRVRVSRVRTPSNDFTSLSIGNVSFFVDPAQIEDLAAAIVTATEEAS